MEKHSCCAGKSQEYPAYFGYVVAAVIVVIIAVVVLTSVNAGTLPDQGNAGMMNGMNNMMEQCSKMMNGNMEQMMEQMHNGGMMGVSGMSQEEHESHHRGG